jgi:hypothetical protein
MNVVFAEVCVQLLLWLLQRYMLTRIVVPAHVD